jgi:hypothetical protein
MLGQYQKHSNLPTKSKLQNCSVNVYSIWIQMNVQHVEKTNGKESFLVLRQFCYNGNQNQTLKTQTKF